MSSLYTEIRKEHLKTWRIWYAMNQRCDPNWRRKYLQTDNTYFAICDEWSREEYGEEGFLNFFDCVGDLEHVSDLHRKDPSKPYGPHNIIKGDVFTRVNSSSYCNTPKARGAKRAKRNGIPSWVYYQRLNKLGWSIRKAYSHPYRRQRI